MEIAARKLYCGSLGWLAPNGDCSLNVAIRTIEMSDGKSGIFGVGGGIVHDSQAELEWEECLWKARILDTGYAAPPVAPEESLRSEEPTSELQSLLRISYAVFCLKKKNHTNNYQYHLS